MVRTITELEKVLTQSEVDEAIRLDKDNQIVYAENKALVIKEQEEDNV